MIAEFEKKNCFVGFDTSNYTTSAAICGVDGRVIANLKIPLTVKEGQRGLRQSDAVFEHVRNLPVLCKKLQEILDAQGLEPIAVGVSVTPRDVEGSYMPCFLSGRAAASAFAASPSIPLFEFSHQNGHVMAAAYSSGCSEKLLGSPFVAFHVSGGTTEALYVDPGDGNMSVTTVGETKDINAGQLIDRVGVALGLNFPAGVEMERLAGSYVGKVHSHPVCVKDACCSLSGAENIALKLYNETKDKAAVAAFVFKFVEKTLIRMAEDMQSKYGKTPILFAGGVMSNVLMREALSEHFDAYFAEPEFSADNAAGISLLCRKEFYRKN